MSRMSPEERERLKDQVRHMVRTGAMSLEDLSKMVSMRDIYEEFTADAATEATRARVMAEAVAAVEKALIAHAVEDRMHAICAHQARIAAEAAAPYFLGQGWDEAAEHYGVGAADIREGKEANLWRWKGPTTAQTS